MTLGTCMAILTWLIAGVGIAGFWMALKYRVGWLICVLQESLYIGYGLGTKQFAFIVHAVVFGVVFMRNWIKDNRRWKHG